jgi:hypothetical protein
MGSSDLPNSALLGENRLDDERCELHPDTSPSVSTMSREMRPLSLELRHPLAHAPPSDTTTGTRVRSFDTR